MKKTLKERRAEAAESMEGMEDMLSSKTKAEMRRANTDSELSDEARAELEQYAEDNTEKLLNQLCADTLKKVLALERVVGKDLSFAIELGNLEGTKIFTVELKDAE